MEFFYITEALSSVSEIAGAHECRDFYRPEPALDRIRRVVGSRQHAQSELKNFTPKISESGMLANLVPIAAVRGGGLEKIGSDRICMPRIDP